ncbi:hypothetical protein [Actinoplanes sp. L3-i22]|uniref:hypothetical protein n=1 Tax=Actinoplanes sp. L3-i22 TaxID=2836373 RepID=UPI001C84AA2B|nr:hypothetical protein [Actinoplanes sp. L3-i22]
MTSAAQRRIATLLRCVAIDHRIGPLLVLDAPPGLLAAMARALTTLMSVSGAPRPETVVAGSWLGEDDLWVRLRLADGQFRMAPGILVEPGTAPIVLVPELSRAGTAVTRAAVTLLGAEVATVERHGHSGTWQPRARWLAGADRSALAGLSPHLLDRFPIRVDAAEIIAGDLVVAPIEPLTGDWPQVTEDALAEVLRTVGRGARLGLALARTARALARLSHAAATTATHVRAAAEIMGLVTLASTAEAQPETEASEPGEGVAADPVEQAPAAAPLVEVQESDEPATVEAVVAAGLYPEASPGALPEITPLRNPWAGTTLRRELRGAKIGTERARSRFDLAPVPTLLEAVKHRRVRPPADRLEIRPEDWRRYRRGWTPGKLLVLVLDHSCHRGWDWTPALAPYLRWAYAERAAVSVVDLGHDKAADWLRAERYRASSVRDSRVLRSLRHTPGRATPLASGIELAAQELLRHLRRSRVYTDRAWLVVVTDGRGNVPLEASARGTVAGPIARQGIDDALAAAAAIRPLAGLRTIVVAPEAGAYAMLPFDLADALGGVVVATGEPR